MQYQEFNVEEKLGEQLELNCKNASISINPLERRVFLMDEKKDKSSFLLNAVDRSIPFVHISYADFKVTGKPVFVKDISCEPGVKFTYQINGSLKSSLNSNQHLLKVQKGHYSMFHMVETGGAHFIDPDQTIQFFYLSFNRNQFIDLLDPNEKWGERLIKRIDSQHGFTEAEKSMILSPAMLNVIYDINNCSFNGQVRNLFLEAKVLELLAYQMDQMKNQSVVTECRESLSKKDIEKLVGIKSYIDQNFLSDLPISFLTREFGINSFKLKKGFKQLFGKPVFSYIKDLKMQYAKVILSDRQFNINEVAEKLGYINPNHFSTAFKKHFGVNPSALAGEKKSQRLYF
jgi:AraC-like DNA-binding protein